MNHIEPNRTMFHYLKPFFLIAFVFGSVLMSAQKPDSVQLRMVDSLIKLNQDLIKAGKYERAMQVITNCDSLSQAFFGKNSPQHANSRYNHGRTLDYLERYEEAERWYVEAVQIWDQHPTEIGRPYCWTLNNLAVLYAQLRQYEKADSMHQVCIRTSRKVLGNKSIQLGLFLYNYSHYYNYLGYYERALEELLLSQEVFANTVGREDPDYYGWILIELADIYESVGQYKNSEKILLEVKDIWAKAYGVESSSYSAALHNLAVTYEKMGDYERVEPLFQESIDIQKKRVPFKEVEYALDAKDLANYYTQIGKYAEAEKILLEINPIIEKSKGRISKSFATALASLAQVYYMMGSDEKAEYFYQDALQIRRKLFPEVHPDVASSLNNLGYLFLQTNRFDSAFVYFNAALATREKLFGKKHPTYIKSLAGLAETTFKTGNSALALQQFEEVLALQEATIGKEHPDYVNYAGRLTEVLLEQRNFKRAEPLLLEAENLNRQFMAKALYFLTEKELQQYRQQSQSQSELIFSVLHSGEQSPRLRKAAWQHTLSYKGFSLLKNNMLANSVSSAADSTQKLMETWTGYQRQLYQYYLKPAASRDSLVVQILEAQTAKAEQQLVRLASRNLDIEKLISWNESAVNLKKGQAAIEFVQFNAAKNAAPGQTATYYGALILPPNDSVPFYLPLFEESRLAALLEKTVDDVRSTTNLYAARTGDALLKAPTYGAELYNLIWKPIDSLLRAPAFTKGQGAVKTVYFSPSGLLHRVAFAALPTDPKKVLADRYQLYQLGSTRSLINPNPQPAPSNYTATVFGGVDYQQNAAGVKNTADENFSYLPGTLQEARRLEQLLTQNRVGVQMHTGTQATEEALKILGRDSVKSPDILHIATHGFFFPDPEQQQEQRLGEENAFKWNENPLFRSGLAMAGANAAWSKAQETHANLEDGIATAYEISHLNLSNTKLVVLSACETGLGDIKGSEGVYGLQRAFKMAGADFLLVSLWQVPDKESVEFMDAFYGAWLKGKTIHEAFARAQKKMRHKYKEAYKWGAWVLVE